VLLQLLIPGSTPVSLLQNESEIEIFTQLADIVLGYVQPEPEQPRTWTETALALLAVESRPREGTAAPRGPCATT
jgi:hypothetical protein